MNLRRALFAIPALFVATVAAGACSSSSTGASPDSGTGTGAIAPSCTELKACCPLLPMSSVASCNTVVAANNATECTGQLTAVEMAGLCSTSGSSGSGGSTVTTSGGSGGSTVVTSGGNTSGATSGPGSSTTKSSGGKSSSTAGPPGGSCANPPAGKPVGLVGPTGVVGAGQCTAAEAQGWGACEANFPTSDAGINMCLTYIGEPDGNYNDCGTCVDGTYIADPKLGLTIPPQWGTTITAIVYDTLGDPSTAYPVGWELNFGGCVLAEGGSSAKQCGIDIMTLTACELITCLPLCAVPEASENDPGAFDGLISCTSAADNGACASYLAAIKTDCATAEADGGIVDKCNTIFNKIEPPDGGKSSATGATWADLIGITCGGADAGI